MFNFTKTWPYFFFVLIVIMPINFWIIAFKNAFLGVLLTVMQLPWLLGFLATKAEENVRKRSYEDE